MREAWLPAEWVAEIAGISPARYGHWVKRRILRAAGYGQCTEAHAFEAAVAAKLRNSIASLVQLRIAVDRLRPALSHVRNRIPGMMDIVWDRKRKRAVWVYSDRDIAAAVRVSREVVVIPMSKRLQEVRDEFQRQAQERADAARPGAPILNLVEPESA